MTSRDAGRTGFLSIDNLWIALAVFLFGAALLPAWLLRASDLSGTVANIQNVIYNTLALLALLAAYHKTRQHNPRAAAAWLGLGIAQGLYLVGDSIYLVNAEVFHIDPYPSLADIYYLLYYPAYLAAIILFPLPRQNRAEKIQMLFEMAITVLAAALFTWYFLIVPLTSDIDIFDMGAAITVAYPVVDLFMLVGVMLLIFRQSDTESPIPALLLMGEAVVTVVADFFYSYLTLHVETPAGGLIDLIYQVGYILIFAAGVYQAQYGHRRFTRDHFRVYWDGRSLFRLVAPNLWVTAVFLLLIYSLGAANVTWLQQVTTIWVGVIIAVAVAFQVVLTRENERLANRLTFANNELEQRVEARTRELAEINAALSLEVQERRLATEALTLSREQYRAVVEDLPILICRYRPDSVITFANTAYCRYYGRDLDRLLGTPFLDLLPPEERSLVRAHYLALTFEHPTDTIEHLASDQSGEARWQRWINRAIFKDGRLVEYQAIGEDVTERRKAEAALRESEEKFRDLFDNSTDLIQIIAPDGRMIFVNNAWRAAMGYSPAELDQLTFWDLLEPNSRQGLHELFDLAMAGRPMERIEAIFVARSGAQINVEGNINCAFNTDHRPLHLRGIFHDITERKKTEAQLIHQAYNDSLTGLPNRTRFIQRLGQAIDTRQRNGYTGRYSEHAFQNDFAVLFLDLDNFKYINDSLGHTAGDQLLNQIGMRLVNCVRSRDLVARLGGDEFVFLLEDITDPDVALQATDRILEILRAPMNILGHTVSISGSIGVVLGDRIQDVDGALRDADIAMYQAKSLGKNQHFIFEPWLRANPMERMRLESDLRLAQERNELRLFYQPVIHLPDRRLTGFEALLRWQHPERGLLNPVDFIPLAEETGLIVPVGTWALQEACRQLHSWRQTFAGIPLTISVNLSTRQVAHPNLAADVRAALETNQLDPASLALELTETAILEDFNYARQVLHQLSDLGVLIYLDDFGSGYSSLARLQSLPFDAIKIDRSFIEAMTPSGENMEILRAIAALSKELHVKAIAEGIELPFHIENLIDIGCTLGQGFLFARPLPVEEAETLFLRAGDQWQPGS